ncbi:hypothetical protein [Paenibacillus kobensis]|uniref:hypothetical protein n=1 Tax=Paenibacillus kobensis TaxID=59841 RepID=UPI000FDBBFB2|nr:hypothetical protein [Paenibacillus kobensis]
MNALTLDLINREANKPVLYQTNDPSRNELTLIISNNTGTTLTFDSDSRLRIGFANLLTSGEVEAITVADAEWHCTAAHSSRGAAIELSVRTPLQLDNGSSKRLTVSVPTVSGQPTSGNVTLFYTDVTGAADDETVLRFFLIKLPSGNPVIPLDCGWLANMPAVVNVSSDLDHLLANSLGFYLNNRSDEALAKSSAAGLNPRFMISFPTIPRPDSHDPVPVLGSSALTYDDLAQDIWIRVIGDGVNQWSLAPSYGSSNESLMWELKPLIPDILGGGQSVEIIMDHIRTVLPPFTTSLHIQYLDIPGYDDGFLTLHLQKSNPLPGILLFYAEVANIDLGESAILSWNTFAIRSLELSYSTGNKTVVKSSDNGDIQLHESSFKITTASTTTYTLTAYTDSGECVQRQLTVTVNQLQVSMGIQPLSLAPGGIARLTWEVTGSDQDTCVLEPGYITLPLSGTDYPLTVTETMTYAITAYNSKRNPPYLSAETTVSVPPASIVSFTSSPSVTNASGAPVVLEWKTEYASSISLEPSDQLEPPIDTHPLQAVDSRTVRPCEDTTYTLTASGINGAVQRNAAVEIHALEIVSFTMEPSAPAIGTVFTLRWETKWADSVTLNGLPLDVSGSVLCCAVEPRNYSFNLICSRQDEAIVATLVLNYGS